jgi:hypothetical protein
MKVKVLDYDCLSETEAAFLNKFSETKALFEQLWFIALLSDNKVKIFIYGDYETVLFVPYRSKFGVKYAFMPVFLQKLSFLGGKSGRDLIVKELINTIRFGEISFSLNPDEKFFDHCKSRKNLTLNLNKPYDDIRSKFSQHHKRNCNKARKLKVTENSDLSGLISIYKSEKRSTFGDKQLNEYIVNLLKLEKYEIIKKSSIILNAFDENRLVASIFFLNFNGVLYYILGSSIKSDKEVSKYGLFRLFDHLINIYSNQGLILDFEGSDVPGISRFFRGFGALESEYQFVRWNELPFPLKIIKN